VIYAFAPGVVAGSAIRVGQEGYFSGGLYSVNVEAKADIDSVRHIGTCGGCDAYGYGDF
jgi:hypothetical protein